MLLLSTNNWNQFINQSKQKKLMVNKIRECYRFESNMYPI